MGPSVLKLMHLYKKKHNFKNRNVILLQELENATAAIEKEPRKPFQPSQSVLDRAYMIVNDVGRLKTRCT